MGTFTNVYYAIFVSMSSSASAMHWEPIWSMTSPMKQLEI